MKLLIGKLCSTKKRTPPKIQWTDVNSMMEPLHVPKRPITKRKAKKTQDIFTLHLQKLANSHEATNNIESKIIYYVS